MYSCFHDNIDMRLKVGSHKWYIYLTHTHNRTRNMVVIWCTHFSPFPRKIQEQRKKKKKKGSDFNEFRMKYTT